MQTGANKMSDSDKLPSGHTVSVLKEEDEARLKKLHYLYQDGVMRLNPGNWIMSTNFLKFVKAFHEFEVRPKDIFVVTYPKSGTTWAQEIVWNLIHNPDLDNPAASTSSDARVPTFEAETYLATSGAPKPCHDGEVMTAFRRLCPGKDPKDGIMLPMAVVAPDPRLLKTHLPLCFLPQNVLDTAKVVYVTREPRDVMTSLYHFQRLHILWQFKGTLDDYVECIVRDETPCSPQWNHIKLAWEKRNHPNMCFIFYEDLKKDPEAEIRRIDKFLGTNRNDQQIRNIVHHTNFETMKEFTKKNPPTSSNGDYFNKEVFEKEGGMFRKGIIGDWKNRFTPEQAEKLSAWVDKNLEQFDDDFKYKHS